MRLSGILLSLSCIAHVAIVKGDAEFLQVRTRINLDMSGRAGDPPEKYFHESIFHPHYDGRFAEKELDYHSQRRALENLAQTYLKTFADIGVETWLMHGTLLGWWWNKRVLPWDSDLDMQVSEASMFFLASYYNMTTFRYQTARIPEGREYMLEVNSHFVDGSMDDELNVIDARWVDMQSGLFIDITTARKSADMEGVLYCKDGHQFREEIIYPLHDTVFVNTTAKIPYAYVELLVAEYGEDALTDKSFANHEFDDEKMEWLPAYKPTFNVQSR